MNRENLKLLNKQNTGNRRERIINSGKQILSSGAPNPKDFNDVLKYGNQVLDPSFKQGNDTKSQITYNPYKQRDYNK